MLNRRVLEIGKNHATEIDAKLFDRDFAGDLPDIPVLPETLLRAELLLKGTSVDLRELTQIVMSDLGAALQVYRLARMEYGAADERPRRVEDCIVDLGLKACFDSMSRRHGSATNKSQALIDHFRHARAMADLCSFVADEIAVGINPAEAYVVGLFHELGALPALLGWERGRRTDPAILGMQMAIAWSLPKCVREYFCELQLPGPANEWVELVQTAHSVAAMPAH